MMSGGPPPLRLARNWRKPAACQPLRPFPSAPSGRYVQPFPINTFTLLL